jgi:16S rRNA processing protein RimM
LFGADDAPLEAQPLEVESVWRHRGALIVKFRGIDSISAAERLEGAEVRIPLEQRAPLAEGEYYQSDLVGCEVIDRRSGQLLGVVKALEEYGGPGLLVVEGPRELMIPFARAICPEIDVAGRRILVELPEGLADLSGR